MFSKKRGIKVSVRHLLIGYKKLQKVLMDKSIIKSISVVSIKKINTTLQGLKSGKFWQFLAIN
jgi:hypothetical protein